MVVAEAGVVSDQRAVLPIATAEDAADRFQRAVAVAFGNRQAGAVAFDAVADAFAGGGDAGDVESGGLAEGAAAAFEAFVGGPRDIEGGEDRVEVGFLGDAAGSGVEVDVVDLPGSGAAGDIIEQRLLIGAVFVAREAAGTDEVLGKS